MPHSPTRYHRWQRKLQFKLGFYFRSIRRFLNLSLLAILTFAMLMVAILNYWQLTQQDQEIVKMQLANAAHVLESLSDIDLQQLTPQQLAKLLKGPASLTFAEPNASSNYFSRYYPNADSSLAFQVWDTGHQRLLIRSDNSPSIPMGMGLMPGFHNYETDKTRWQVFILDNSQQGLRIIVAIDSAHVSNLNENLFLHHLYILLAAYVVMAILLLIIIEFALRPLKRIAKEVSQREPNALKPISSHQIPTEIRPLIKELNQLFHAVRDTIEREKRFTADAAHELRTPLAALKTQVEVARRETDDATRATILKNIIFGVNRCAHVIDQLLTLSRLEPQATLTHPETVNLTSLASEMVAELAPIAIEKQIDIALHAPNHPVLIYGHATSLLIMLRNLIDNAIRYTPNAGQVNVIISETPQGVCLQVIDSGPGIPLHLRQRIFERFFRELGNKVDGSGLGLSIVQQIIRLHQAQIQARKPASGSGLEMWVLFTKLPRREQQNRV